MSKITFEMYFVHAIEWGVELVIPPINMKFSHRMSRIGDFSEFRSGCSEINTFATKDID